MEVPSGLAGGTLMTVAGQTMLAVAGQSMTDAPSVIVIGVGERDVFTSLILIKTGWAVGNRDGTSNEAWTGLQRLYGMPRPMIVGHITLTTGADLRERRTHR